MSEPAPTEDQFVSPAREAIQFTLVSSGERETSTFAPEYCHQVFGEAEQITGYRKPSIDVRFHSGSLKAYINFSYEEKKEDAADVFAPLAEVGLDFCGRDLEQFNKDASTPFSPFGEKLAEYTLGEAVFEIHKMNPVTQPQREYLDRLESFVTWYIDGALPVDSSDAAWIVYTLHEKYVGADEVSSSALIGFCLIYPFFAFPEHQRHRIAQYLILPPFQGKGHGGRFLEHINTDIMAQPLVVAVAVEDPAASFQHVRDKLDCAAAARLGCFSSGVEDRFGSTQVQAAQTKLKLSKKQALHIRDIFEFASLQDSPDSDKVTAFRLRMKHQLNKDNADELAELSTPEERKKALAELYEGVASEFRKLIPHTVTK